MYDFIKGTLAHKQQGQKGNYLTVETAGLGYLVEINYRTYSTLDKVGSDIKVFTVLLHREDHMSLCGFLHREDRDIFKILTSVSGVGAKMALMLLDEFEATEIISLVIKGDFKALTRAKGIGPKLAQKIILELKDKLINLQVDAPICNISDEDNFDEQAVIDARSVLISLGYDCEETKKALSKAIKTAKDVSNAEDILKEALRILSSDLM